MFNMFSQLFYLLNLLRFNGGYNDQVFDLLWFNDYLSDFFMNFK